MDDSGIVELYWARSESAIAETASKYGKYCFTIAFNILASRDDADESVNDTYMSAWSSMPPHRPSVLSTFLGKITRRISIDKWRRRNAGKRGGGEVRLALDELSETVPSGCDVDDTVEKAELARMIDNFLTALPDTERRVFVCRYWYFDPIASICRQFGFSQSKVKSMLRRTRGKLHLYLEKEGIFNEF